MCRRVLFAGFLTLAPLSFAGAAPVPLPAQSSVSTVTFRGTIVDATRSPIAGASVAAVPDGGAAPLSTQTDSHGAFVLSLPAGTYTIHVDAAGFDPQVQTVQTAQLGSGVRDYMLAVAGVRDSVTVVAPGGYEVPAIANAANTPSAPRS